MTFSATVVRVFAGTWLAYAGLYLCRRNFSVIMPSLGRDLAFTNDGLASLVFAYSLCYALGQFVCGTLADRYGPRRTVALGMAVSATAAFLMAGASAFVPFVLLQGVNGFAQSAGWPGLVRITAREFQPPHRGALMAWWSTHLVIGGLVATLLATWLANTPQLGMTAPTWRAASFGPGLGLLAIAALFLILVRPDPQRSPIPRAQQERWSEVLRSGPLRSIAIAYFCLKLVRYTFLFWLPLYMVQQLRYSEGEAGYASSVYELVGFLGVPLAGHLSDRVFGGRRFPVAALMMSGLAVACLFFTQWSAVGAWANLASIAAIGILTFGPDSLISGPAVQDSVTLEATATAAGFVNGVGSAGQVLSPFLVSLAVGWVGWNGLFSIFVCVALAGAAALASRWNLEARVVTQACMK